MKFVVSLPYGERVLDQEDALKIVEILSRAEKYDAVYRNSADGGTIFYVSKPDTSSRMTLQHLPDDMYEIAKLAGPKPSAD